MGAAGPDGAGTGEAASARDARGIVAAGHAETAAAAAAVLREGGNAFDAVLAATCAACVAEPVLASLGGGGFLLAHEAHGRTTLYDFFVQTPAAAADGEEVDFCPILADFGPAQQEFHIGRGSVAVPGTVAGLFEIHRDLCRLPMTRIVEPAAALARRGVEMTAFQAYLFRVIGPILGFTDGARALFHSRADPARLMGEGEVLRLPELGRTLEALAREGADLFYRGEIADRIVKAVGGPGGSLARGDLESYRVARRVPLDLLYRGARLAMNPPPSTGGILVAFALELLKESALGALGFGSPEHLVLLARAMEQTNRARAEGGVHEDAESAPARLFDAAFLEPYRAALRAGPPATRGTTHMSVIDSRGNAASLTLTNGEGCGTVIPGTGVMLNNMLGEEDINPLGFHRGPPAARMCSMMSPTLIFRPDGGLVATGSGGSNRIRTAILQVLLGLLDFGFGVEHAVAAPRIHFEQGLMSVEPGFPPAALEALRGECPRLKLWEERNLFFGGAHTVAFDPGRAAFAGAGDPRRAGVAVTA